MKTWTILFIITFPLGVWGQNFSSVDSISDLVKVGIKEAAPFIIENPDGTFDGVSIDLWKEIAVDMGLSYEFVPFNSLDGMISAIQSNKIDLSINPLTVTSSRLLEMDFTQPFFITHLAVASKPKHPGKMWTFLKNLFSWQFFSAVILLVFVILIFGFIVWLFERKKNMDQFSQGAKGLGDGFWWSAVTMTTVGYGDKSPVTVGGKVVALIWMFTAIIIISSFTAGITSALTVQSLQDDIKNIRDLQRFNVGTIEGSSSYEFLKNNGIKVDNISSVEEGLDAVVNNQLEVFVYDAPIMKYLINQRQISNEIRILPKQFQVQYYSFALPKGSLLRDQLDPVLLNEINNISFKAMLNVYNLED